MRGILARSAVVALVLVAAPAAALAQSTLHTFYARIPAPRSRGSDPTTSA